MATRTISWTYADNSTVTGTNSVALAGSDTSNAFGIPLGTYAMTLQATGTFDSGTIALQGSNDGSNFVALPTAVSLTSAGVKSVADLGFKQYKVVVSGGGGTCALTATIHIKVV